MVRMDYLRQYHLEFLSELFLLFRDDGSHLGFRSVSRHRISGDFSRYSKTGVGIASVYHDVVSNWVLCPCSGVWDGCADYMAVVCVCSGPEWIHRVEPCHMCFDG